MPILVSLTREKDGFTVHRWVKSATGLLKTHEAVAPNDVTAAAIEQFRMEPPQRLRLAKLEPVKPSGGHVA